MIKDMKNLFITLLAIAVLAPNAAIAQGITPYINETISFFNNIVIPMLFAVAILFFLINATRYFVIGSGNESERAKARMLATYGILAFVFIVAIWGIVGIITTSFGLIPAGGSQPNLCPDYMSAFCGVRGDPLSSPQSALNSNAATTQTTNSGGFTGTTRSSATASNGAVCAQVFDRELIPGGNYTYDTNGRAAAVYTPTAGDSVQAINNGQVTAVNNTTPGQTILTVTDESGIEFYYTYSNDGSSATPAAGDTVRLGDQLGTVSGSGSLVASVSVDNNIYSVLDCNSSSLQGVTIPMTFPGGTFGSGSGGIGGTRTQCYDPDGIQVPCGGTLNAILTSTISGSLDPAAVACYNFNGQPTPCNSSLVHSLTLQPAPGTEFDDTLRRAQTVYGVDVVCKDASRSTVNCDSPAATGIDVISNRVDTNNTVSSNTGGSGGSIRGSSGISNTGDTSGGSTNGSNNTVSLAGVLNSEQIDITVPGNVQNVSLQTIAGSCDIHYDLIQAEAINNQNERGYIAYKNLFGEHVLVDITESSGPTGVTYDFDKIQAALNAGTDHRIIHTHPLAYTQQSSLTGAQKGPSSADYRGLCNVRPITTHLAFDSLGAWQYGINTNSCPTNSTERTAFANDMEVLETCHLLSLVDDDQLRTSAAQEALNFFGSTNNTFSNYASSPYGQSQFQQCVSDILQKHNMSLRRVSNAQYCSAYGNTGADV